MPTIIYFWWWSQRGPEKAWLHRLPMRTALQRTESVLICCQTAWFRDTCKISECRWCVCTWRRSSLWSSQKPSRLCFLTVPTSQWDLASSLVYLGSCRLSSHATGCPDHRLTICWVTMCTFETDLWDALKTQHGNIQRPKWNLTSLEEESWCAASDQHGKPFWVCRKNQAMPLGDRSHSQSAICHKYMRHTTIDLLVTDFLLPAWKMNHWRWYPSQ